MKKARLAVREQQPTGPIDREKMTRPWWADGRHTLATWLLRFTVQCDRQRLRPATLVCDARGQADWVNLLRWPVSAGGVPIRTFAAKTLTRLKKTRKNVGNYEQVFLSQQHGRNRPLPNFVTLTEPR